MDYRQRPLWIPLFPHHRSNMQKIFKSKLFKVQEHYKIMMKSILSLLLILILGSVSVSAYSVPQTYQLPNMNDMQIWKVSEEHISDHWAQDNLCQFAQNYANYGISTDKNVKDFVKQPGLKQLRLKMSYYAIRSGYPIPIMK